MKNDLQITVCQPDVYWEKPKENQKQFEKYLDEIAIDAPDLVLFPELFLTGFTMNTSGNAESMDGAGVKWMRKMAEKYQVVIGGSHIIRDSGKVYNRFLFVFSDGKTDFYDKRHLFRMGEEHRHYQAGTERKVFKVAGWNILPIVCYDLRFPVWIRNRNDYDVMICVANWPSVRQAVWNNLLVSRAIENACYVAGVNRTGIDGREISYTGGSQFIDPKGNRFNVLNDKSGILSAELSKEDLTRFREKFPVHLDADDFLIKQKPVE